ncbi:hypothetical protein AB0B63_07290 [Micromonospora sp. NPDC049081]|uniref:hypothetical protein n=1 Tax=Micromonospora sp. NPDC049081 TaxID=3155150 RepID=UPI0033CDFAB6
MSIDLILEVMDHAPADLTSGERMVLTVIAERANDKTRIAKQSSRWTLDTVAHRAGVKRTGLKSIFQGLARKGCEVRVPVKVTPEGKPVFAFEGTAVTFKIPNLAERGGHSIPTQRGGQSIPTEPAEGMPQHPRGEAVASERGGHSHPQSLKTLKEPSKNSSLSARTSVTTAREDVDTGERDEVASPENPTHDRRHHWVIEAGCPPHLAEEVVDHLEGKHGVKHIGWWKKVRSEGDLPALVQEALNNTPRCVRCNGTGEVWLEEFSTTAKCSACPTGPAAHDHQGRTSDRENANSRNARGWLDIEVTTSPRRIGSRSEPPPGHRQRPDGSYIMVDSRDPNIEWSWDQ